MKTKRFKKVKGFTLVELIVVIAIVSVLAVVGGLTVTQWVGESRDARVKSDVAMLGRGLETYLADPENMMGLMTGSSLTGHTLSGAAFTGDCGDFSETFVSDNDFGKGLGSIVSDIPEHPDNTPYKVCVEQDTKRFSVFGNLEDAGEYFQAANHGDLDASTVGGNLTWQ